MHLHLQLQEVKRCFFHFCHMHIHPITFPDCSFRYSDYRIRWNAYLYYFTLIMMAMVKRLEGSGLELVTSFCLSGGVLSTGFSERLWSPFVQEEGSPFKKKLFK